MTTKVVSTSQWLNKKTTSKSQQFTMKQLAQKLSKLKNLSTLWFILPFLLIIIILFSTLNMFSQQPSPLPPSPTPTSTPAPNPTSSPPQCPENGWVNCMPGPDLQTEKCTKQQIDWYEKNCPNFKGVAQ